MNKLSGVLGLLIFLGCAASGAGNHLPFAAAADKRTKPNRPKVSAASNEGRLAMSRFQIGHGMRVSLFAAEPLVANPVCFAIDERGRFFVAETFRQLKGVEDNRDHLDWLHDDLRSRTVADRLRMYRKFLGKKIQGYTREEDRIRLVEDTNGDGVADQAKVFANGFNGIVEGTGAGVLARNGNVWYTCIPRLWRLRDTNGDGKSDDRVSLLDGFGVRVAFRGHDMHGLRFGPDGRLYFSIGDRGYNVVSREGRRLVRPDAGAVFRCEPDGSRLEVFAYGLRNPQELAFDDLGNLIAGDNNCDSGDHSRCVYVVEGGDSGWRMYYQYLKDRGPWNRERIWYPYRSDAQTASVQPAFIVPPVGHIAAGPAGLTCYPGVGLSPRYARHFFLCDFRGDVSRSGVLSFALEPKGATFELVDSHKFIGSILATDVEFGYDGNLYVSDWVHGWNGEGKGRIYRFRDPKFSPKSTAARTATLMRDGFAQRTTKELVRLLDHPDRRIRQHAQFALADRRATSELINVATTGHPRLVRLHAIWGLGQIARRDLNAPQPNILRVLLEQATDTDVELRAQSIRVLGDITGTRRRFGTPDANWNRRVSGRLTQSLRDGSPRVRFFAAIGLGHVGLAETVKPLFDLLNANQDKDPLIRHAAVMGLVGIGRKQPSALLSAAGHPSRFVRKGIVLALRRLKRVEIATFLDDIDPEIVLEAARAINDIPIDAANRRLALLADRKAMSAPLLRRVLNANFREGQPENARAVARIAADPHVAEAVRLEALAELQMWKTPTPLDRVLGSWRPLKPRSVSGLAELLRPLIGGLLSGSSKVRQAAIGLMAQYGIREIAPVLRRLATDPRRSGRVRVEALRALASLKDASIANTPRWTLTDHDPLVRSEGRRLLVQLAPARAVVLLNAAVESGETFERQDALAVLAAMKTSSADARLSAWLDRLLAGRVPPTIELDLIEAAKKRGTPQLLRQLHAFEQKRNRKDPLAEYRVSLVGGNAVRGHDIFFTRTDVSCVRCHKIRGRGGDVGPDLSKIGNEKKRDYLLESMILPNKQIAKGFQTVVLAMDSGQIRVGILKSESPKSIQMMTAEGQRLTLNKGHVEDRTTGRSAMPDNVSKRLSKRDIRDLVEFLASQKRVKQTADK